MGRRLAHECQHVCLACRMVCCVVPSSGVLVLRACFPAQEQMVMQTCLTNPFTAACCRPWRESMGISRRPFKRLLTACLHVFSPAAGPGGRAP